jgi:hypothetical protein
MGRGRFSCTCTAPIRRAIFVLGADGQGGLLITNLVGEADPLFG